MAKISIRKPDPSSFRGWTFVVVLGGILAVLALIHQGGVSQLQVSPAAPTGSTGCMVEVVTDNLNVRRAANQDTPAVRVLARGARLDATVIVTNGYRQLADGNWALTQYLTPLPGSNCG